MNTFLKFPFAIRASIFIIGLFAFLNMLYLGQEIIIPIIFAALFAVVLNPAVNFLIKINLNRTLSISLVLVLFLSIMITFIVFFSMQLSSFSQLLPMLVDKFYILLNGTFSSYLEKFNLHTGHLNDFFEKNRGEVFSHLSQILTATLGTLGNMLFVVVLVIIFIFMILFYSPHLNKFIHKLSGDRYGENVNELIASTHKLIQHYLLGMLIEAIIVAVLYSGGLYMIGIEYPFFLGILGALLNIIPYLGGLVAASLYVIVAFATKDSSTYVLLVLGLFVVVHLIDNSIIIPKVVASKVKINALVAVTVILAGGALWGIPGMFISIPLTGVIKLIFDRIEALKPYGFLLGDETPAITKIKSPRKKRPHKS